MASSSSFWSGVVNMAMMPVGERQAQKMEEGHAAVVRFRKRVPTEEAEVRQFLDEATGLARLSFDWKPRKREIKDEWLVMFPAKDVLDRLEGTAHWDSKKESVGLIIRWTKDLGAIFHGSRMVEVWYRLTGVPEHWQNQEGVERLFAGRGVVLVIPQQLSDSQFWKLPVDVKVGVRDRADVPRKLQAWTPQGIYLVEVQEFPGKGNSSWTSWSEVRVVEDFDEEEDEDECEGDDDQVSVEGSLVDSDNDRPHYPSDGGEGIDGGGVA